METFTAAAAAASANAASAMAFASSAFASACREIEAASARSRATLAALSPSLVSPSNARSYASAALSADAAVARCSAACRFANASPLICDASLHCSSHHSSRADDGRDMRIRSAAALARERTSSNSSAFSRSRSAFDIWRCSITMPLLLP